MKNIVVFVQIPVFNEEKTIASVLDQIPKQISGIDSLHVLVINDGSTDRTLEILKEKKVEHVLSLDMNSGLGVAFRKGLAYAISHGADIIVNTDGDNQYHGSQIVDLIAPILQDSADVVIGDRQVSSIAGYPKHKLFAQNVGNFFLKSLFQQSVLDATSGFRAFNKTSAEFLVKELDYDYTYTVQSLCMLLKKRMRIQYIPIKITYPTRKSRLIKNNIEYVSHFIKAALGVKNMDYQK